MAEQLITNPADFTVIAHRGWSAVFPENTQIAFRMALENGFGNIETDYWLTADDIPVVLHEKIPPSKEYWSLPITETPSNEVEYIDVGGKYSPRYSGQNILTADDLHAGIAQEAHFHGEIKDPNPRLPERLLQSLEKSGLLDPKYSNLFDVPGYTITSFHLDQLLRSLEISDVLVTSWLVEQIDELTVETAKRYGIKQLGVRAVHATADSVGFAHENGLSVRGMGIDSYDHLLSLLFAGAEGGTINWPDRAKNFLDARQKSVLMTSDEVLQRIDAVKALHDLMGVAKRTGWDFLWREAGRALLSSPDRMIVSPEGNLFSIRSKTNRQIKMGEWATNGAFVEGHYVTAHIKDNSQVEVDENSEPFLSNVLMVDRHATLAASPDGVLCREFDPDQDIVQIVPDPEYPHGC